MPVRFAPSPTGSFHLGNLRTAWISHWWAKKLSKPWVVRFENIDIPRNKPGAKEEQLNDLERLGLVPDEIIIQSDNFSRHWSLLKKAAAEGKAYPCFCSRKDIALASAPHDGTPLYTGKCRELNDWPIHDKSTVNWRFKTDDPSKDLMIARTPWPSNLASIEGFVPAYQWACAIDDIDGGYDLLVRAHDLKDSAEPQRLVQRWVSSTTRLPGIFHTSLVVSNDMTRLEKRTTRVTLEELIKEGSSIEFILERFEESFHESTSSFSRSKIFGESKENLTLGELGFDLPANI